jgi:hypothetical protein
MAIKYYEIPERKQIVAVMEHTKWDGYHKIQKMLRDTNFCFAPREKYMMPDVFKVIVTCDPRDEYDFMVGAQIAKKKLMRNYYKSLDKRLDMFKEDVENLQKILR